MARQPVYKREDHRALWEHWFATRNLMESARRVGISIQTANRWKDDYACPFNCNYHRYDHLLEEVSRAQQARQEALEAGITDPVAIDQAMRSQIRLHSSGKGDDVESVRLQDAPAMEMIRKQDLVVADYEFLYRKLYYLATGQAIAPNIALIAASGEPISVDWATEYEKGLKINNLDKAIETLMRLRQDITKMVTPESKSIVLEQTTETQRVTIPLEELAKMREHILKIKKDHNLVEHDD